MENKPIIKTILKLALTVVLAMTCIGVGLTMFAKMNYQDIPTAQSNKEKYKEPVRYNVDMFMVGNASFDDELNDGALDTLKPILSGYDLAFCNQDSFKQEYAKYIQDLGFNMINLANDNTLDKGEQGVLDALGYWKNQEGIYYTGCAESLEDRANYQIFDINNIRFGFLGYTDDLKAIQGKEYLVNIYDKDQLIEDLNTVRGQVDVLVVAMNWNDITNKQELAKLIADNGADVIIGNNDESIEPVAWIDDTICFYSLGNMFSDDDNLEEQIGMMGSIKITKSVLGDEVDITISQPKADLIYTDECSSGECIGHKLYTFDELTDEILPNYQEVYNEYINVINQLDDSIIVGNIK